MFGAYFNYLQVRNREICVEYLENKKEENLKNINGNNVNEITTLIEKRMKDKDVDCAYECTENQECPLKDKKVV